MRMRFPILGILAAVFFQSLEARAVWTNPVPTNATLITVMVDTNGLSTVPVLRQYAPASTVNSMAPLFTHPSSISSIDGNGNAVNETFHRTDVRSYNRSYAILGLYAMVDGQAIGSSPVAGMDLWTYDTTNDPFSSRASPRVSFGMHSSLNAIYHGHIYTLSRGTNNNAADLIFEVGTPVISGTKVRMLLTTEGDLIVSNRVLAGQFVGDGSGLTNVTASASVTNAVSGVTWQEGTTNGAAVQGSTNIVVTFKTNQPIAVLTAGTNTTVSATTNGNTVTWAVHATSSGSGGGSGGGFPLTNTASAAGYGFTNLAFIAFTNAAAATWDNGGSNLAFTFVTSSGTMTTIRFGLFQ